MQAEKIDKEESESSLAGISVFQQKKARILPLGDLFLAMIE
jgi:hypothetical protein